MDVKNPHKSQEQSLDQCEPHLIQAYGITALLVVLCHPQRIPLQLANIEVVKRTEDMPDFHLKNIYKLYIYVCVHTQTILTSHEHLLLAYSNTLFSQFSGLTVCFLGHFPSLSPRQCRVPLVCRPGCKICETLSRNHTAEMKPINLPIDHHLSLQNDQVLSCHSRYCQHKPRSTSKQMKQVTPLLTSLSLENIPVSEPVTPQAVWGGLQGGEAASSPCINSTMSSTQYGKRKEAFDWNRGLPSSPSGKKQ